MTKPKSILITGCSSGIGLSCALGLHKRGYRVFATARKSEDVEKLKIRGLESLTLDLADSASIQTAVTDILQRTGGTLDALLNNAAHGQPGAVEDLSRDALRANFETNVFGTHELTTSVLPAMRRQGHGRIIQISSLLGILALPYRGAYSASKFALEGLSDTMRLELHDTSIKVSIIVPGPITSRFRSNAYAMYQKNIDKEKSPYKRVYEGMEKRLLKKGPAAPFTLPPEAVLEKLVHALESDKPKIRYYVTLPTYFFAFVRRALPFNIIDKILQKISRDENRMK